MTGNAVEEYVAALQQRDWQRMGRTLTENVRREGPEGATTDAISGRDAYLQWSSDLLDPLYGFEWRADRITSLDEGRIYLVEATSKYEPSKGETPFGYRLAVIFDLNHEGLIESVSFYWKSPQQRLTWDTVAGRDA